MNPSTPPAAEMAVCGSILLHGDRALIATDAAGLSVEHFVDPDCRKLFRTAVDLRENAEPLDEIEIRVSAGLDPEIADKIQLSAPATCARTGEHAALIVRAWQRRKLATMLDAARQLAADECTDPEAVRAYVEERLTPTEGQTVEGLEAAEIIACPPPPHDFVLEGLFDRGSLVEIVGPSKARKSFAVMQLALSLASGRPAFGFMPPRALSVAVCDLELTAADIRRRLHRMAAAMNIDASEVADRLRFLPLAGCRNPMSAIEKGTKGAEVVVVDPLYALCDGSETIENMREPLRWLRRMALHRMAALYVHHDGKGTPGDRNDRDRGSGSGITGRAVDARLALTPLASDPDNAVVVSYMLRSYQHPEPAAWAFVDGRFEPSDLPAEPERASDRTKARSAPKVAAYRDAALRILADKGPLQPRLFKDALREQLRLGFNAAASVVASLTASGDAVAWTSAGFPARYFIGLPSQAECHATSVTSIKPA